MVFVSLAHGLTSIHVNERGDAHEIDDKRKGETKKQINRLTKYIDM